MKSKFQNFDFGSVEVLSQEEAAKVKGGAYGVSGSKYTSAMDCAYWCNISRNYATGVFGCTC
jgi:hypothetical protein